MGKGPVRHTHTFCFGRTFEVAKHYDENKSHAGTAEFFGIPYATAYAAHRRMLKVRENPARYEQYEADYRALLKHRENQARRVDTGKRTR